MKFKTLEDITDENLQQANAAAVTNFIGKYVNDELDEASTKYAEDLEKKEQEAQAKEEAAKELQKKLDETLAEVTKAREELKKEQEIRATQKVEADFNNRMADLDANFELNDKDRSFIAKDIKGLDDEAYATWIEKFEVFAAAKKKGAKVDAEDDPTKGGDSGADEDVEDKKKKKSAKASVEAVLATTEENKEQLPPNNTATQTTIKEEFADAFKIEDFKIKR